MPTHGALGAQLAIYCILQMVLGCCCRLTAKQTLVALYDGKRWRHQNHNIGATKRTYTFREVSEDGTSVRRASHVALAYKRSLERRSLSAVSNF